MCTRETVGKLRIGVEPVSHQAQRSAPKGYTSVSHATEGPTIRASPTTFHTVSEGEFSEVRTALWRLATCMWWKG